MGLNYNTKPIFLYFEDGHLEHYRKTYDAKDRLGVSLSHLRRAIKEKKEVRRGVYATHAELTEEERNSLCFSGKAESPKTRKCLKCRTLLAFTKRWICLSCRRQNSEYFQTNRQYEFAIGLPLDV